MELLAAMQPKFLRLPGGNYLEGDYINERFDWKKTIGDVAQRPGHRSPWNYWSTDGFGLLEYLEWCEDLHMEPLLAVFAGYALRHDYVKPGPDLEPYVQDALDEIEYVTGDTRRRSGARNARRTAIPRRFLCITSRWATRTGLTVRAVTTDASRNFSTRSKRNIRNCKSSPPRRSKASCRI